MILDIIISIMSHAKAYFRWGKIPKKNTCPNLFRHFWLSKNVKERFQKKIRCIVMGASYVVHSATFAICCTFLVYVCDFLQNFCTSFAHVCTMFCKITKAATGIRPIIPSLIDRLDHLQAGLYHIILLGESQ